MNEYDQNFDNYELSQEDTRSTRLPIRSKYLLNSYDESNYSKLLLNEIFLSTASLIYDPHEDGDQLLISQAFARMESLRPDEEARVIIDNLLNHYKLLN